MFSDMFGTQINEIKIPQVMYIKCLCLNLSHLNFKYLTIASSLALQSLA